MNTDTRQLLNRWQSLKKDGGLQRAASMARTLWFVGLLLCLFVVFGVICRLHPALIAVAPGSDGLGGCREECASDSTCSVAGLHNLPRLEASRGGLERVRKLTANHAVGDLRWSVAVACGAVAELGSLAQQQVIRFLDVP